MLSNKNNVSVSLHILWEKITPVRLLKNFPDMYAYSFWKIGHPVRLLQTVHLLETLE